MLQPFVAGEDTHGSAVGENFGSVKFDQEHLTVLNELTTTIYSAVDRYVRMAASVL